MNRLLEEIDRQTSIAIAGHKRPDGDCIGSCLGLYNYILDNYRDKKVDVYLEEVPEKFKFIKNSDAVKSELTDTKYDLFIVLDTSDTGMIAVASELLHSSGMTICIDHHISNKGYARFNVIEPDYSSASELLYTLLDTSLISREVAEAIYTGIVHDTGVFRHSCTSSDTMKRAGILISKGVNFTDIINNTYFKKTYVQNQLLSRALLESVKFLDGRCIFSVIKESDLEFYKASVADLDGIVDSLRNTEGIECAVFLHEIGFHEYKVSLRSDKIVNVSEIASYFGGGGHVRAAGCNMAGTVYDVINNISLHIEQQLQENQK